MKIPFRILFPVLTALICAGLLLALLWWQLVQSAEFLRTASNTPKPVTPLTAEPVVVTDAPQASDRALVHLRQGDLLALRGEWPGALSEYELSVQEGGGIPALRKLAQAQLQRRDLSGARRTIKQLKEEGAKQEDLLLLESIVELRSGELVRARTLLEDGDDTPQKHYGLALLSIIEGNHDRVQTELTEVINGWEPVLRSHAKTIKAAYDEYTLFPESPEIHLITLLSRALAQVQECELALPLLLQVTSQKTDYRDAWIVQGFCELTTERGDAALLSFEQAYNIDPQKPETQYFLGRAYSALNQHENAITFFEYAVANGFEPITEVRQYLAEEALKNGDGELALQQYALLVQEPDANIEHFAGFVTTNIALDQPEEAYVQALEAAQRWQESAKANELLGIAAAETGRTDEARKALEKALQLDPFLVSAKERLDAL